MDSKNVVYIHSGMYKCGNVIVTHCFVQLMYANENLKSGIVFLLKATIREKKMINSFRSCLLVRKASDHT